MATYSCHKCCNVHIKLTTDKLIRSMQLKDCYNAMSKEDKLKTKTSQRDLANLMKLCLISDLILRLLSDQDTAHTAVSKRKFNRAASHFAKIIVYLWLQYVYLCHQHKVLRGNVDLLLPTTRRSCVDGSSTRSFQFLL